MKKRRRHSPIQESAGDSALRLFSVILMAGFSLLVIMPIWWLLVDSFSTVKFYNSLGIHWFPDQIVFDSYKTVLMQRNVGFAYRTTILRTATTVLCGLAVTFCGAYALSKPHLKMRRLVMFYIIIPMYFGGGLIPAYLNIRELGLYDTFLVYVLPGLVSSYNLIVMRNFISSLPNELEESAMIDGANAFQTLFYIIVPLSMPIIATVGLWIGVAQWNSWFDCMMYVTNNKLLVLQMLVRKIILENQVLDEQLDMVADQLITSGSVRAATIFVAIGPIILIYPFVQKYFVKGVMIGAVKQ